ncbi:MAG: AAA family ATPase, partial [Cyclobacteriaceae bacterium]|nr:AAA family ATPase [Cyclobacteriaceae bacterium]
EKKKGLPKITDLIISKLLKKDPDLRYQSVEGLIEDLKILFKENKSGKQIKFEPGRLDIGNNLVIPYKLYGRQEELKILSGIYNNLNDSILPLVFISGQGGVGKTMLVKESFKLLKNKPVIIASGKYEKFKTRIPYSGFKDAMESIANTILLEPENEIKRIGKVLQQAVYPNGSLITNLCPAMEQVIGKQENLVDLGVSESKARLFHTIETLLLELSGNYKSIILNLDDIQWADEASITLFEQFVNWNRGFLAMFSFRDADLEFNGLAFEFVQKIKEKERVKSIYLKDIPVHGIEDLLKDVLKSEVDIKKIAERIYKVTSGNALLVHEYIKSLFSKKFIQHSIVSGKIQWKWDLKQIIQHSVGRDTLDTIRERLGKVSDEALYILKAASVIGSVFSLKQLKLLIEKDKRVIWKALGEAVSEGFIFSLNEWDFRGVKDVNEQRNNEFAFIHDSIHDIIYEKLDEEKRTLYHFILSEDGIKKRDEDLLFNTAYHIINSIELIQKTDKREKFIEILYDAGIKARVESSFDFARECFSTAKNMLKNDQLEGLSLKIYYEKAKSEYACRNYDVAEKEILFLLDKINEPYVMGLLHTVLSSVYQAKGKWAEALDASIEGLQFYGLNYTEENLDEIIGEHFGLIGSAIEKASMEEIIEKQETKNEEVIIFHKLLINSLSPAYVIRPRVFPLLISFGVLNSLEKGYSQYSGTFFILMGRINVHLGDFEKARFFNELGLKLVNKINGVESKGSAYFSFTQINAWNEHLKKNIPFHEEAIKHCKVAGDLIFEAYDRGVLVMERFSMGRSLKEVEEVLNYQIHHIQKIGNVPMFLLLDIFRHFILKLGGDKSKKNLFINSKTEEGIKAKLVESQFYHGFHILALFKAEYFYFMDEWVEAKQHIDEAWKFQEGASGQFSIAEMFLYKCLIDSKCFSCEGV